MNLILFHPGEIERPLPKADPRAAHILKILKVAPGQTFDVGSVNGPRGKAELQKVDEAGLHLGFLWEDKVPSLVPIDLWVSFCRPQTCRRILQECTSLGVRSINFFTTDKCEPSYRESRLWSTGEAKRLLIRGAEQAFCTQVPELLLNTGMEEVLGQTGASGSRIALDNYEATSSLGHGLPVTTPVTLAVGGERGWSKRERDSLRNAGFRLASLGERVLRTETACIAGISILRTQISSLTATP